jgi:hypothetical protein
VQGKVQPHYLAAMFVYLPYALLTLRRYEYFFLVERIMKVEGLDEAVQLERKPKASPPHLMPEHRDFLASFLNSPSFSSFRMHF